MAIKYGTVKTSINEEMNDLRRERDSNVPRPVRKWRDEHPNPYRGDTVYGCYSIPKEK